VRDRSDAGQRSAGSQTPDAEIARHVEQHRLVLVSEGADSRLWLVSSLA
jgi:hypothetical protein